MVSISVDKSHMKELERAIEGTRKSLPKEMANALNKTRNVTRTTVSKEIRKELNITGADVKKFIRIAGNATATKLDTAVILDHEKRPGVGGKGNKANKKGFTKPRFNPVQNAKGTAFTIGKKKGRTMVNGAFMGPRPGRLALKLNGGVFQRTGGPRSPIQKLYGLSPWAAYLRNNMDAEIHRLSLNELTRQINSRIRTVLKQKGLT